MTFDPAEPRDGRGRWSRLSHLMKDTGGFTHDFGSGTEPTEGFSVGVPAPGGKDWQTLPHGSTSARDIAYFAKAFAHELAKPNRGIGGWSNNNPEWGDVRDALDIVEVHKTLDSAMAAARAAGQDAIYDLGKGEEIPVPKHDKNLSILTPRTGGEYDLARGADGKLAFWKQILPKKTIHYTAKDGRRGVLNFDDAYLTDLAKAMAVDKVPFMLADSDNRHTMDPERYRGDVVELAVREDGLYGKIVFPNEEAARAVLMNPDLPVSARIRENVQRSDGTTVPRGIIHVLGTLDPQVSGMSGWQTTDLSTESGDLLDLSNNTFDEEKAMPYGLDKPVSEYTDEEIDAFTEEQLDAFLAAALDEIGDTFEEPEDHESEETHENEKEREPEMALSNEMRGEIDLANARANKALRDLAEAKWEKTRSEYLSEGVPPHMLDLAAPVLNRPDEMVIDLSVADEDDVNVSTIVRGLLDSAKGMIDLSTEQGHGGTFRAEDGTDPDAELLAAWDQQF